MRDVFRRVQTLQRNIDAFVASDVEGKSVAARAKIGDLQDQEQREAGNRWG